MKIVRHHDPAEFVRLTEPMLMRDEPRHHRILGRLHTLVTMPARATAPA